ncbi:MAG: hypothetical protein ACOC95_09515 [Planctomycetota bacterium]
MRHYAGQFCVAIAVALALTVPAAAEITLIEDFTAYPLDTTIHDQGDWENFMEPHWQAQRNSSILGDHGWSTVVEKGDNVALELINRDFGGELDTVYTAMNLGMNHYIYDTGTIYIRFMAETDGDTLVATNNFWAGWDYGGFETGDAGAPSYQGTATGAGAGYANNCMLVELSAEDWRAYNGGYEQHPPTKVAGTVYEMWMQMDMSGQVARFYLCEDGGTPTVVLTEAQDEWWSFRTYQDSVENLKFFAGVDDGTIERPTYIESIAINTTSYVTDRPDGQELWDPSDAPTCNPGDADGDGDVDLDDFVILKNNFGTTEGATCDMGDFDGDGDVDLDDFVLLKTNFGATY